EGEGAPGADLRRSLRGGLGRRGLSRLPPAWGAHADPAALPRLDARADAFLVSRVANRASRRQGRAFLDTCARIFPAELSALREQARQAGLLLHQAPISGGVLRELGIPLTEAQQLLLSLSLRGLLFAAVRLGIAGTHEAQRIQHEMSAALDEVLAACADLGEDPLARTAPLADLFGSTHDRLYSRLCQS